MSDSQIDLFNKNLEVVENRWPDIAILMFAKSDDVLDIELEANTLLVNSRQLTSNYDRQAEAFTQAQEIPFSASNANIYGVGLGDLARELLNRDNINTLNVNILNIELFVHVLNALDQTDWLSDKRVILRYPNQSSLPLKPFAVSPIELDIVDNCLAELRDRIVLELDNDFIHFRHDKDHIVVKQQIAEGIELLKIDDDVKALFDTYHASAYVVAAGPTLNDHIERLKKNTQNNLIISVDAAIKTLVKNNIVPDIVVTVDHQADLLMDGVDLSLFENTVLLHFPRGTRNFVNNWPGKRYCAYSYGDLFDELNRQYPRTKMFAAGSVLHTAVDLIVKMGAKQAILLGADFGFPDDVYYAQGQTLKANTMANKSPHWVFNGKGEKIPTLLNYRGFLRDLEVYIERTPNVEFINGSDRGAKINGTRLIKDDE